MSKRHILEELRASFNDKAQNTYLKYKMTKYALQ